MIVLEKVRFLCTPKTGSQWCKAALKASVRGVLVDYSNGAEEDHAHCTDPRGSYLPTMAFVRHPVTWWQSFWAYKTRINWTPTESISETCKSNDFNEFIRRVTSHEPGFYSKFLEAWVGEPEKPIDFVGKFENLADDLEKGLTLFGEAFDPLKLRHFPPVNTTNYDSQPTKMTGLTEQLILETERRTLKRFYND